MWMLKSHPGVARLALIFIYIAVIHLLIHGWPLNRREIRHRIAGATMLVLGVSYLIMGIVLGLPTIAFAIALSPQGKNMPGPFAALAGLTVILVVMLLPQLIAGLALLRQKRWGPGLAIAVLAIYIALDVARLFTV
jgi:uncharacterized membrane protein (DUF2068 family)